ncbi:MAG: hypothetical protein RRZ84_06085 [Romboutsia sp.]
MFIFISLALILFLIYFCSMVYIQYSNIANLNLQFGMDVTKLYGDEDSSCTNYINSSIKTCAMFLFKAFNSLK